MTGIFLPLFFMAAVTAGCNGRSGGLEDGQVDPDAYEDRENDSDMDGDEVDAILPDADVEADPDWDAQIDPDGIVDVPEESDTEPPCDPSAPGTGIAVLGPVRDFTVTVGPPRPAFRALTDEGIRHYPDSAVTFIHDSSQWVVYIAAGRDTYRLTGLQIEELSLLPSAPVLSPTGDPADPHHGYAGSGTAMECGGGLVMFFHAENHAMPGTITGCGAPAYYATMNRAMSADGGMTFVVDSPSAVVTSSHASAYRDPVCAYGAGGGSVTPMGEYLFMYYFDWNSPQYGLHLARACRNECGAPGSWRKYLEISFGSQAVGASFDEPSGDSTAIVRAEGGDFDAFVTVSRNTYLNAYLMVSATVSGFALRASQDGIAWGPRVELLDHLATPDVTMQVYYPSMFDGETFSRYETGRNLILVFARVTDDLGHQDTHRAYMADIELTVQGDTPTATFGKLVLSRYHKASAPGDHWSTTGTAPGYSPEGAQCSLASNSIPDTHPLYECIADGYNHYLSQHPTCEGGTILGITGYAWSGTGPGRTALRRCYYITGPGTRDDFISTQEDCEGHTLVGIVGYVEP